MEEFDPRRASFPKFQDREENSGGGRTEELSEALRNVGNQRSGVRSGLNKVLSFEPLTPVRDLIIVGEGPAAEEIFHYCHEHTVRGYRFRGVFHDKAITGVLSSRQLGSIDAAKAFATQNRIDILYCALPSSYREEINGLMEFCERNTIRFRVIPSTDSFIPVADAADLTYHGAVPVSRLRNEPLDRWSARFVKRAFDIVFSFLVITLIFSWLFPILAILVKLSSKGPVFFKQDRLGERRKKFSCYKFRSMRTNVDSDMKQATKDDPRITRIGAFLRKTSLDEFPQFFNVLMGSMSVVGPRPHPLKLNDQFRDIIDKYMVRHFVRPGITGWAQVNGFRGETRTPELMEKRVDLDVWYLENWSFMLDLKIVLKTVTNAAGGEEMAY